MCTPASLDYGTRERSSCGTPRGLGGGQALGASRVIVAITTTAYTRGQIHNRMSHLRMNLRGASTRGTIGVRDRSILGVFCLVGWSRCWWSGLWLQHRQLGATGKVWRANGVSEDRVANRGCRTRTGPGRIGSERASHVRRERMLLTGVALDQAFLLAWSTALLRAFELRSSF